MRPPNLDHKNLSGGVFVSLDLRLGLHSGFRISHHVIALKTPHDDGTTHVVLSPMEFMGRLAALVPRPRVNLTRFHGVFSRGGLPYNSKLREYVVPQKPIEEQENPKPKAYSRPGRVRMGPASQARFCH